MLGHDRAITLIAMATPEDLGVNAEHVRLADFFVDVPGGSNVNNYANVRLIVATARRVGADAVWPGWGHASEDPSLPTALDDADIAFLGPPSGPMAALGDKVGSSILAQAAGVPTIPWSGSNVEFHNSTIEIPDDVYRSACVDDAESCVRACKAIGYPVMIKASWGGGGKGIRRAHGDEEVRTMFPQVAGEVPRSPIFVMKLAPKSRHLEVQLLCDKHGGVCALHTRDCSVQRRHQKIIEEGPATIAPDEVLRSMENAACALARHVGYVGAATCEYLYAIETGEFFFLELNPRLQVEHPVSESISGVNIPASQLLIAMGIPLHRMPELRRLYGLEPVFEKTFDVVDYEDGGGDDGDDDDDESGSSNSNEEDAPLAVLRRSNVAPRVGSSGPTSLRSWPSSSSIGSASAITSFQVAGTSTTNWVSAAPLPPSGHCVAVRITSEDPNDGFKPTSGAIAEISFTPTPSVWGYFSVRGTAGGGGVHTYADSQFGHVFARGANRAEAISNMRFALANLRIRGEVRHIVDYVNDTILGSDDFSKDNTHHTGWLDNRIASNVKALSPSWDVAVVCGAIVKATQAMLARRAAFEQAVSRGQTLVAEDGVNSAGEAMDLHRAVDVELMIEDVKYSLRVARTAVRNFQITLDSEQKAMTVPAMSTPLKDGGMLIEYGGTTYGVHWEEEAAVGTRLFVDDRTVLLKNAAEDPTVFRTVAHGKLVRRLVNEGSVVHENEAYAEIEVMKMIMSLRATATGAITFFASEGDSVVAGDVLATVAMAEEEEVKEEEEEEVVQEEQRPLFFPAQHACAPKPPPPVDRIADRLALVLETCDDIILKGYDVPRWWSTCSLFADDPACAGAMLAAEVTTGQEVIAALQHYACHRRLYLDRWTDLEAAGSHLDAEFLLHVHEVLDAAEDEEGLCVFPAQTLLELVDGEDERLRLKEQDDSGSEVDAGDDMRAALVPFVNLCREFMEQSSAAVLVRAFSNLAEKFAAAENEFLEGDAIVRLRDAAGGDVANVAAAHGAAMRSASFLMSLLEAVENIAEKTNLVEMRPCLEKLVTLRGLHGQLAAAAERALESAKMAELRDNVVALLVARKESPLITTAEAKVERKNTLDALVEAPSAALDGVLASLCHPCCGSKIAQNASKAYMLRAYYPEVGRKDFMGSEAKGLLSLWRGGAFAVIWDDLGSELKAILADLSEKQLSEKGITLHVAVPAGAWDEHALARNAEGLKLARVSMVSVLVSKGWNTDGSSKLGIPDLSHVPRRFAFSVNAQAGDVKAMPDLMVRACEPVMGVRLGLDRVAAKLLEEKGLKEKDVRVMPSRAHEACFVEYKDKGLKTVVVRGIVRAHVDMQVREIVEDIVKPLLEEIDDGSVDTSHVCLKVLGGSEGLNAKALAHDVEVAVAQSLVPSLLLHRVGCVGVTLEIGDTVCVDVATPSGFGVAQVSVVDELPSPFPSLETVDVRRRAAARKAGGFLISDAVELLQLASDGCDVTDVEELVLSEEASLVPVSSPQAHKEAVGMRIYSLKLNGCSVLIVGNDLTHRVASMGVKECKTFVAACERAEKMQTPLLFLNASSGARLGVDEEMKKMLTFAEDGKLVAGGMEVSSVSNPNADYGVPSLSACGATARAYSKLYDHGMCVTVCIGRAVGIGAYLARLGRRTIQVAQTPIILTGQAALNKVLGKDVYESNAQLGGPQIMHQNGVTHLTASNCLEAMKQAVNWMEWKTRVEAKEPARPVPPEGDGALSPAQLVDVLFDAGSFVEVQRAWAKSVVCGRARLNGRAVGVIATQTATTELVVPADPGDFSTSERRIQHPGCLWLPDSAAKTAEALEDMGREHLPIIILANWRGFSGGLRDLFEGVLQAGSGIVEGLRKYPAPVFVYIPRGAELRGGAWVVLDKQINEHGNIQILMDPSARGGILEPEGTAEIRFKKAAIHEWMERDGADEKEYPKYRAGALRFCDSHDRAEALLAQQVIDGVVDLADARGFLTKKLNELLLQ